MSRGAVRVEGLPVRYADAGGVRLAYLEVGTGSPVLLVPGFTGSKEDFGPVLAPLAAAGHRVVAVDQRGQLDSPGAGDAASYSPDLLARDLLAFVDALGLAPGGFVTPILSIVFCLLLMAGLPIITWLRFVVWLVIGLAIYFLYSRHRSEFCPPGERR